VDAAERIVPLDQPVETGVGEMGDLKLWRQQIYQGGIVNHNGRQYGSGILQEALKDFVFRTIERKTPLQVFVEALDDPNYDPDNPPAPYPQFPNLKNAVHEALGNKLSTFKVRRVEQVHDEIIFDIVFNPPPQEAIEIEFEIKKEKLE